MNFMSKSKSYLLSDEKSIKKRISFGFTKPALFDNSVLFEVNTDCVLQKVNSHEFLEDLSHNESSALAEPRNSLLRSSMNVSQGTYNVKKKLKTIDIENSITNTELKPASVLSLLVSPVGINYRSKLSRLMKNRLNKSQVTLDGRSTSKTTISNLIKEEIDQEFKNIEQDQTQLTVETSSFSEKSTFLAPQEETIDKDELNAEKLETFSNRVDSFTESFSSANHQFSNKNGDTSYEMIEPEISENSRKNDNEHSSGKFSKLNRSISSSILSINFKRKKLNRQSMHNDQVFDSIANNTANNHVIAATRKSLTSKNLLKQIENLHEQTENKNSENKTLDRLINIYNSELTYLNHLKNAFEVYAEPLRKFSSLTSQEYNLLFANLEPIISLSCNLSIRLENLINNFSPYDFENTGNLLGKKLFECYEEYINSYSSIVKLLNQKFKQNEIKELCELRQSKSSCLLSLHEILALPLERIIYYQELENKLTEIHDEKSSDSNDLYKSESVESHLDTQFRSDGQIFKANDSDCIDLFKLNKLAKNQSKSEHNSIVDLDKIDGSNQNLLLRNKSFGDILNRNNDCIDSWKEMKDTSDSLVNLNDQMSDTDTQRLASLASIQQTFPNDDLKLFDLTITPSKFRQNTPSSSLTQTVKSGLEKMSKFNLINTTPVSTSGKISLFNTLKKSDIGSSKELFSNKKLSESYDTTKTPKNQKLNRTPTITTSAESHLTTTLNKQSLKKKGLLTKQGNISGNNTTNRAPSFVAKHFQIQRRKTIHDIVNFELLNNLISTESSGKSETPTNSQKQTESSPIFNKHKSQISLDQDNSVKLNKITNESSEEKSKPENEAKQGINLNQIIQVSRSLIKQNHVQLINQYDKQDRYFFLFNDLLIIAKQKNETHNKLKHRVLVSDIWLSDCFDTIYWQYNSESSIVIGWPPAHNFIADFKDPAEKESWVKQLKELIAVEKKKEEDLHLNIKICFNKDNFGGSEPTQYSECFTKTVQVRTNETAQEIVNRCKCLFNLEPPELQSTESITNNFEELSNKNHKASNCVYQLWLKTDKNEPLIPLIGHEFPFVIKMNFLREAGRSIKDDDNSHRFILIDKNARLHTNSRNNQFNNNHSSRINSVTSSTVSNSTNQNSDQISNAVMPKYLDVEAEKQQKLRKKMFWNRINTNLDSNHSVSKTTDMKTVSPLIKSASIDTQDSMASIKKPENKLLNSFKHNESSKGTGIQFRSTSLSHASSYKQQRSESVNLNNVKSNIHKKSSNQVSNDLISHKLNSNGYTSHVNSSLKPFYNKLKKSHLFGVKLDKLCGPYSQTNCKLPNQIISLLEKVAYEGQNSLMIFRKSASARLKKTYKEKLDSNQTIDYNEMNVHVSALLLKEYLRDYPDGIIDYHLYNECLIILKITDIQQKLTKTKTLLLKLPKWNLLCLKHFMCLFCCIVRSSQVNKMDSHNLSVCVAPSIFHKLDRPHDVESSFQAIAFIKYLIDNCEDLFGIETLTLLKSANNVTQSSESQVQIQDTEEQQIVEENTKSENMSKKQVKSSIIMHRREIGRMLNFALKGKKSLKLKKQEGSIGKSLMEDKSIISSIESIVVPAVTVPTVVLNSPPKEIEDSSDLDSGFNKIALKKEIRRRTSTNNSDQKAELNTMLVVNDENEEDEVEEGEGRIHRGFNSDDDVISDQEDYYTYNDDIVAGDVRYVCSNDDGITLDYGLSKAKSTSKPRYKGNDSNSARMKNSNLESKIANANTDSNNETSLSVNNLVINKHDLSSNTLSVDSGLSVPTATNSDPESEKSTNLNLPGTSSSVGYGSGLVVASVSKTGSNTNKEDLDASKLKHELEKHKESTKYCIEDHSNEVDKQAPHLRRQRRMLTLNSNSDKERILNCLSNHSNRCFNENDGKTFSESEVTDEAEFKTTNTRRISTNKIAPLAPHIQAQSENLKISMNLVPYKTEEIPYSYQKIVKSNSQSKKKRLAPMAQVEVKTEPESDTETKLKLLNLNEIGHKKVQNNNNSSSTSSTSSISSKSTSTETAVPKQAVYYSNHHYHHSNRKNPTSNRKSVAKVKLDNTNIAELINFNYMYEDSIREGTGLASDLNFGDSVDGSSTTIYVPYNPNTKKTQEVASLVKTSSLVKKHSQRRKLSKTIRDYKPSRQLQRQLSHQQREVTTKAMVKLSSQSFKTIKNKKKSQVFDTESSTGRDTSSNSLNSRSGLSLKKARSKAVVRAKSLNSQFINLSINKFNPVKRSSSIGMNELSKADIKLISQSEDTSKLISSFNRVNNVRKEEADNFVTRVYSNPTKSRIEIPHQIDICLSSNPEIAQVISSENSKTQSLSSASSVSISSNQSKVLSKIDNNNNHSISLNEKSKNKKIPVIGGSKPQEPKKTVEVTWSVSNIRKQFEKTKLNSQDSSDHSVDNSVKSSSSSRPCSNFGTIKINRHNIQRPQIVSTKSPTLRNSTSSFSSISSNSAIKFFNYQDSNGNPITYI